MPSIPAERQPRIQRLLAHRRRPLVGKVHHPPRQRVHHRQRLLVLRLEGPEGKSTISTLASFDGTNGSSPMGGLTFDADGNLYGTTLDGGADGSGTVWEFVVGADPVFALWPNHKCTGCDRLKTVAPQENGRCHRLGVEVRVHQLASGRRPRSHTGQKGDIALIRVRKAKAERTCMQRHHFRGAPRMLAAGAIQSGTVPISRRCVGSRNPCSGSR